MRWCVLCYQPFQSSTSPCGVSSIVLFSRCCFNITFLLVYCARLDVDLYVFFALAIASHNFLVLVSLSCSHVLSASSPSYYELSVSTLGCFPLPLNITNHCSHPGTPQTPVSNANWGVDFRWGGGTRDQSATWVDRWFFQFNFRKQQSKCIPLKATGQNIHVHFSMKTEIDLNFCIHVRV